MMPSTEKSSLTVLNLLREGSSVFTGIDYNRKVFNVPCVMDELIKRMLAGIDARKTVVVSVAYVDGKIKSFIVKGQCREDKKSIITKIVSPSQEKIKTYLTPGQLQA